MRLSHPSTPRSACRACSSNMREYEGVCRQTHIEIQLFKAGARQRRAQEKFKTKFILDVHKNRPSPLPAPPTHTCIDSYIYTQFEVEVNSKKLSYHFPCSVALFASLRRFYSLSFFSFWQMSWTWWEYFTGKLLCVAPYSLTHLPTHSLSYSLSHSLVYFPRLFLFATFHFVFLSLSELSLLIELFNLFW